MKKQTRFHSIVTAVPYPLRWAGALCAALVVLISAASLFGDRARAGARDCIQLEDSYTNRNDYDVVTGNQILTPLVFNGSGSQTVFASPDARYIAFLWQSDTTTSSTGVSLFLKPIGTSNHNARLLQSSMSPSNYYGDYRDIRWSPDGRFIAYRWSSEDGAQYVALSDTAGNQIARRILENVPENGGVSLHGWSADGKYLAVSYRTEGRSDDPTPPTTIYILSVPDLQPVKTPLLTSDMIPRNFGGSNGSLDRYEMVQWGAFGDWLDYLTSKPDGHNTLTLYSVDTGQMLTADTSFAADRDLTAQVLWAPDGKYIAVLTRKGQSELVPWGLDIFGVDGSAFYNVTSNATPLIEYTGPGATTTPFRWSADSRSLVYPQNVTPYDYIHADLVAFNLDRKQVVPLRSNIYLGPDITDDHRYIIAKWDDGLNKKIDIIDTTTLQRLATIDSLYSSRQIGDNNRVFSNYSPQSGWLIINEDGVRTWAVNVRTGVQRPLLSAFPTHSDRDQNLTSSTEDNRFVGGLKAYSPGALNSDYRVLSLDDGIFHDFHLPPSIVDAFLVDYSPAGEVTLNSVDLVTSATLVSILRSDGSIRRQFTVSGDYYASIQRTNCALN